LLSTYAPTLQVLSLGRISSSMVAGRRNKLRVTGQRLVTRSPQLF
jgi:hypothetical protein